MTIRPVLTDFSAGELSPKLSGRVDLPIYSKGAKELTNFRVEALGGATKRPGTAFYSGTTANKVARIIPWVIDDETTLLLELTATATPGEGLITIFGLTYSQPLTHPYVVTELMEVQYEQTYREIYMVHPDHAPVFLRWASGAPSAAVFEFDDDLQTMGSNLIEWIAPTETPYEIYDFWDKTATWMFSRKVYPTTSPTFAGRTCTGVERRDNIVILTFATPITHASIGTNNNTTLSGFSGLVVNSLKGFYVSGTGIPDGTYIVSNISTEVTLSAAVSGYDAITLTRSGLRMARGSTYIHQGTVTVDMRPFIGSGNYPSVAFFHSGRLWMGGSTNEPTTLWGSKPNDLMSFNLFEELVYDTQVKTDPKLALFGSNSGAPGTTATATPKVITGFTGLTINALAEKYVTGLNIAYGTKVVSNTATTVTVDIDCLAAGTCFMRFTAWKDANVAEYETSEGMTQQVGPGSAIRIKLATEEDETIRWISGKDSLVVGTSSSEWAIENAHNAVEVRAAMISRYGSANIQARMVGASLLYVSASSRHIRQLSADLAPPLTAQAAHMIASGIVQIDFQQAPDVALYAVLANGEMVRCIIDQSLGVMAWDRIRLRTKTTAGVALATPDTILSVAVTPGATRDYVYIVTKRTIAASTAYNIELFNENEDSVVTTRVYLDLSVQKGPTAAFTTVTGLAHLNNHICTYRALLADGVTWSEGTVSPSGGTATIPSSVYAIVGLAYDAKLKTMRIDSRDTEGLRKQVGEIFFRLKDSYGFTLSWGAEAGQSTVAVVPSVASTLPLYTGPLQLTSDAASGFDAELTIESSSPVPIGIQTIVPVIEIGG